MPGPLLAALAKRQRVNPAAPSASAARGRKRKREKRPPPARHPRRVKYLEEEAREWDDADSEPPPRDIRGDGRRGRGWADTDYISGFDSDESGSEDIEDDVLSKAPRHLPSSEDLAAEEDERTIRALERKLGISSRKGREGTSSKRRTDQIKRLNKEFASEGYDDEFGTFLDGLDDVVGSSSAAESGAAEDEDEHVADSLVDESGDYDDDDEDAADDDDSGDLDELDEGNDDDDEIEDDEEEETLTDEFSDALLGDVDDNEEVEADEDADGGGARLVLSILENGLVDEAHLLAQLPPGTRKLPKDLRKTIKLVNRSSLAKMERLKVLKSIRETQEGASDVTARSPRRRPLISWGDALEGGLLDDDGTKPAPVQTRSPSASRPPLLRSALRGSQNLSETTTPEAANVVAPYVPPHKRANASSSPAATKKEAPRTKAPKPSLYGDALTFSATTAATTVSDAELPSTGSDTPLERYARRRVAFARAGCGVPTALPATEAAALTRRIQGVLNRLTRANVEASSTELGTLYRSDTPSSEINKTLVALVVNACAHETQVLSSLAQTIAALLSALHITVGPAAGAACVEGIALAFSRVAGLPLDANPTLVALSASTPWAACGWDGAEATPAKSRHNLLLLLVYLYVFSTVSPSLIAHILRVLSARFAEPDAELILVALQHAGFHLRADDPSALRDVLKATVTRLKGASAEVSTDSEVSTRLRFLGEMVLDLKNNRRRAEHDGIMDAGNQLRKWLSRLAAKTPGLEGVDRRLRLGWGDIFGIPERGRWWIVGASWIGRQAAGASSAAAEPSRANADRTPVHAQNASAASDVGIFSESDAGGGSSGVLTLASTDAAALSLGDESGADSAELLELARAMRMNTPTRRAVFCALMGAADAESAVERLLRLSLRGAAEREIVRVLIDCAAQEAAYNVFYALVGARLCSLYSRFKFTFQLAFMDFFKTLSSAGADGGDDDGGSLLATQRRTYNLARLLCALILRGAATLAVLKPLSFTTRVRAELLFLKTAVWGILLHAPSPAAVAIAFTRLGSGADRALLRDGLTVFLHRYATPVALEAAAAALRGQPIDAEERAVRVRAAKKALEAVALASQDVSEL